ncbi:MAG: hypothetical protein ABEJ59_03550 [Halanaeroarchaeum sp.]
MEQTLRPTSDPDGTYRTTRQRLIGWLALILFAAVYLVVVSNPPALPVLGLF